MGNRNRFLDEVVESVTEQLAYAVPGDQRMVIWSMAVDGRTIRFATEFSEDLAGSERTELTITVWDLDGFRVVEPGDMEWLLDAAETIGRKLGADVRIPDWE